MAWTGPFLDEEEPGRLPLPPRSEYNLLAMEVAGSASCPDSERTLTTRRASIETHRDTWLTAAIMTPHAEPRRDPWVR
jgi:hypothetical protein